MSIVFLIIGVIVSFFVLKFLGFALKIIFKCIVNSILGYILLFLANNFLGIFLPKLKINNINSLLTGIFGVPYVIFLYILKFLE